MPQLTGDKLPLTADQTDAVSLLSEWRTGLLAAIIARYGAAMAPDVYQHMVAMLCAGALRDAPDRGRAVATLNDALTHYAGGTLPYRVAELTSNGRVH